MTRQDVLSVLMLSPIYFRLTLPDRKVLLEEVCTLYGHDLGLVEGWRQAPAAAGPTTTTH
ncbi:MAG: hypothetical protein AB1634_12650 [Thermodesulfobacteriota bacterium]